MFEEIGVWLETMIGLYRAVSQGISLGEIMSDPDIDDGFSNVLKAAHLNAWADIIANENLNSGQTSMAAICGDAGEGVLKGMNFENWDANDYAEACLAAVEGAECLGHCIEKAAQSINHAAMSSAAGISNFAGNFEE